MQVASLAASPSSSEPPTEASMTSTSHKPGRLASVSSVSSSVLALSVVAVSADPSRPRDLNLPLLDLLSQLRLCWPLLGTPLGELVKFSFDEVTDALITSRTRVNWIPVPNVVVVARQSRTRKNDPETSVATGEQKILEVLPALSQAPTEAVLKPFVEAVGGVINFVAAAFQVPRARCDKDNISPMQLL